MSNISYNSPHHIGEQNKHKVGSIKKERLHDTFKYWNNNGPDSCNCVDTDVAPLIFYNIQYVAHETDIGMYKEI